MSTRKVAAPLQAFVLHRYDWSESSLILDLFTRERGRLAVAAKGARRPYSQLRPVLLPFQRVLVTLGREAADEAAEVHTLRQAEWGGALTALGGEAVFRGFYCNELLMKLLARHDPHPALFDAYAATLPALAADSAGGRGTQDAQGAQGAQGAQARADAPKDPGTLRAQAALRAFELVLLRECGVLPELSVVTLTLQPVEPAQRYALLPESGVVATREESAAIEGTVLLALQEALEAGDLGRVQTACLAAPGPLRTALRALVQAQAGTATLRTRQVMQGVRRLIDSVS